MPAETNISKTCCKTVYDRTMRFPRGSSCSKTVTVERNGKPYCTIHDPERVAKKNAEREAKWKAESYKRVAEWRLSQAAPKLLAACKSARSAIVLGNGREIDWDAISNQLTEAINAAEK